MDTLKTISHSPAGTQPADVSPSGLDQQKSVYISTYGCQMNVNDTERMYSLLEMINYAPAVSPDQAQLIIINSCSVREKPVHKVRSEVGRYWRLKQQKPNLKIGVAGCVAQQEKQKLLKSVPLVDFVFGPDAIDELPHIVARIEQGETRLVETKFTHSEPYHIQTLIRNPGVAAFVNIMKGCDNFCTFCVVPFTRGRERSRLLESVCNDVQNLTNRGVREVTLLGQNVNSYRSQCGADFGQLLLALCNQTVIQRIRFTSPHPKDFNEELIDIMHAYRQKIMPAVHLPAQSGSSQILKQMNRGYTKEEYIQKAHMILNRLPGAVLSTDIIVGFPGETKQDFQETLSLLDKVPFEQLYSFKYSPRPLTKAAQYENQVDEKEKSIRLAMLNKKYNEFAFSNAEKYKGQILDVLVETSNSKTNYFTGRSIHNKLVHFTSSKYLLDRLKGETVPVRIKKAYPLTLYGELVS